MNIMLNHPLFHSTPFIFNRQAETLKAALKSKFCICGKQLQFFFSFVFLFCLQLELKSFYFQEAALRLLKYEKSISWRKCSSVASFLLFVCEFEYLNAPNRLDIFWFYIN